ncbi:MAG: YihY family inner membrane protein [Pseudomonadota bacterium]|nr:YihY family inner membrane protein [Gammaproteobacteria bacterium]
MIFLARIKNNMLQIRKMTRLIVQRFVSDRLAYSASALTITTLLALVPLIAVSIAILSVFPVFHALGSKIQAMIFQNFIPASGAVIQKYLHDFVVQTGKLSVFGTVLLVLTAIMMMFTIDRALNDVWKIGQPRRGLVAFLKYWTVLSLAPIFVAVSFMATTYIMSLPFVVGTVSFLGMQKILTSSVPTVLTFIAFTLFYVIVPRCRVPWRYGICGAFIATVLYRVMKHWFVFYVMHIPTYGHIYGALAAIPIFLVWLYLVWVIVLIGALISNVLTTNYLTKKGGEIDGFTHAFLWLGYLWQAQQQGQGLSLRKLLQLLPADYAVETRDMLSFLQRSKLIQMTSSDLFVLSRDFSQLLLADLYDILPWKFPTQIEQPYFPKALTPLVHKFEHSVQKLMGEPLSKVYAKL